MLPKGIRFASGENFTICNIARMIKSRRLRWAGHTVSMKECRKFSKMSTAKSTRKIFAGRDKREDNIKIDLKEIGFNTRNSIYLSESPYECGIESPCSISHGVS